MTYHYICDRYIPVSKMEEEARQRLANQDVEFLMQWTRNNAEAKDIVVRLAPEYPYIGNMYLYQHVSVPTTSRIAIHMIERIMSWDWIPEYSRVLYILSLFVGEDRVYDALDIMGSKTPVPIAYKIANNDLQLLLDIGVPIRTIYHYILREGVYPDPQSIEDILAYPPTIMREKAYYAALQQYARHGVSEVDILRDIDAPIRLERILSLFPSPDARYPIEECHNDMGLIDSMDEVPPILRYHLAEGTTTYCLPVSEVMGMVVAGNTRNPYTGTPLSADTIRDMNNWLYRLMRRGYPIAYSTASDFYDPIVYDSTMFNRTDRTTTMVEAMHLEPYLLDMYRIAHVLGVPAIALQGVPNLIRTDMSIGYAYPTLMPIFQGISRSLISR